MVHGWVAPGFERVREELAISLARRGELGAACAAYHRGEKVVDLWAGVRDPRTGAPWEEDTMVLVYSTSKGMAAITLALAHSRGWLDYDERVTAYWPEFAAAGKEGVTVRQLLAHEAGVPVIEEPLEPRTLADFDALAEKIAAQRPLWEPGTRHGYHGISLGWYEGELIRRVDPQHRTLGQFFAEEVAAPLGIEFYFGLPESMPTVRLARIARMSPLQVLPELRHLPPRMAVALARRSSITARTFANPRLRFPADLDRREYRHLEFPAGGGIGTVRGIARAYADLAGDGRALGLSHATLEELKRPAQRPPAGWHDEVLKVETAYSLGYIKHSPQFRFGSSDRAFGHPGAGGSFAFADPDRELAFAYAPNRLGFHLNNDPREKALRDAVYTCLEAPVISPRASETTEGAASAAGAVGGR
jgi:CubicO group peptidase (beta-lactamase class C family)